MDSDSIKNDPLKTARLLETFPSCVLLTRDVRIGELQKWGEKGPRTKATSSASYVNGNGAKPKHTKQDTQARC